MRIKRLLSCDNAKFMRIMTRKQIFLHLLLDWQKARNRYNLAENFYMLKKG